ncbi:protein translocase subunit SecD [Candidatus Gottesmanbacteria bacterium]|nr:protein translocase subunit SecD [Candidatus Gottesmanbacteria bacterium]
MFRSPKRVFFLLIALAIGLVFIDLPENYRVKFQIGKFSIDRVINPPTLSFHLFGIRVNRSIKTHLGLDLSGGTHIVLDANMKDIKPQDRKNALESAKEVIERRVNFFGVSEPIVQTAQSRDSYRIVVELSGTSDVEQAVATLGQTAQLEFREFAHPAEATEGAFVIPTLVNTKPVGINGKDLARASLTFSTQNGEPEVAIEFTAEGGKKFGDVTSRLVGKHLPIFLDEFPLTWPTIRTPITDGRGVITGGFTKDQAKILALQLNAGALPVPVSVIEKRTVGATLGSASVVKSIGAGVIGLILVAAFMIAKYGWLGLLADCALLLYGLITFAIFRLVPITLTLPGIAGFLLSMGMAVDANILIFERYKEELRRGKPVGIAMELGFGKAWHSIRDANITTIITSLILYNPGNWTYLPSSGLVRGFAATLLIGVLISLFTGIVVTRTFIRVLYLPRKAVKRL